MGGMEKERRDGWLSVVKECVTERRKKQQTNKQTNNNKTNKQKQKTGAKKRERERERERKEDKKNTGIGRLVVGENSCLGIYVEEYAAGAAEYERGGRLWWNMLSQCVG